MVFSFSASLTSFEVYVIAESAILYDLVTKSSLKCLPCLHSVTLYRNPFTCIQQWTSGGHGIIQIHGWKSIIRYSCCSNGHQLLASYTQTTWKTGCDLGTMQCSYHSTADFYWSHACSIPSKYRGGYHWPFPIPNQTTSGLWWPSMASDHSHQTLKFDRNDGWLYSKEVILQFTEEETSISSNHYILY